MFLFTSTRHRREALSVIQVRLGMFFTRNEYMSRWERVQAAMAAAGYENLLVWQRSRWR